MKKTLILLFLIPVFASAQVEKYIPHDFLDTVRVRKMSSTSSLYWVGRQGTSFNLNGFDSLYVSVLGQRIDTVRHKLITYDIITKTFSYSPWLFAGSGGGGVSSVAAGYGTNFSTITSTGSVIVDTATGIATKNTVQIMTASKRWNAQQFYYQNTTDGGNTMLKLMNDGSNSTNKYATIDFLGSNGNGITGWPNALLIENQAAGGLVLSAYAGGSTKFQHGSGRFTYQNFSTTGALFGGGGAATALVDILGGASTPGAASLKIRPGTLLTITEAGAIENDGTHLYYTAANAGTRYQLDQQSGSGTVTSFTATDGNGFDFSVANGTTTPTLTATTTVGDGQIMLSNSGAISGSSSFLFTGNTFTMFAGSSLKLPQAALSSNTTLDNTYYTVLVDATGGNRTITLPTATGNANRIYVVKKIDASANTVTIDGNGFNIDGAATKVISTQWAGATVHCNGGGWYITGVF